MGLVRSLRFAGVVSMAAGVGLALTPVAAQTAEDTTPPTVTAPVKGRFVTGSQVPVGELPGCNGDAHDRRVTVPLQLTWSGQDDSGSVRYSLVQETGAAGPEDVFVDSTRTRYRATSTNRDQSCGGGSPSVYEWNLFATDPAGNRTVKNLYGGRLRLTQDTGTADQAAYASQPTIAYRGAWGVSQCKCWSDRTVHRTTEGYASATIVPQPSSIFPHYSTAHDVALVMHTGPDRGKFRVVVDGVRRRVVDTYAPTSRPRTIVWRAAFADYGHTIKIVNLATPGRPRIDLDAVLTN